MPARSVIVSINNLTRFPLTKIEEVLNHGAWTWDVSPPKTIPPHSRLSFEGESVTMTGTEGHVRYRIEDGRNSEFYFHWNNPLASNIVGSHYNSFHEFITDDYAIWHTGNDNSYNENVELYIDISKDILIPNFLPSTCGFKFPNQWNDFGYKIPALQNIPLIGNIKFGDASNGLCGGMIYAVRDYYEAKTPIPQINTVPNNADDPLTKYIIDRLLASFTLNDVTMYLKLMSPAYADTDDGVLHQAGQQGRAYVTIKEEWPMIKNDIDNGHPSTIGLIRVKSLNPGDLGKNHQVAVYGYRMTGSRVIMRIYDPNFQLDNTITLTLSLASTGDPVNAVYSKNDGKPIYALFRTNYERRDYFPRVLPPATRNSFDFSISREPNHLDVFWVGNDGRIYSSWWHAGGNWDNHVFQIPGNYPPPAPGTNITSVSREPNHLDIFWIGSDGKIYSSWWHAGGNWDNHVFQIPGNYPPPAPGTKITSVSREPNHLDIFWIGSDGKIYSSWWHAGSNWDNHVFPIPGNYSQPAPGTNITSVSREPNHVDIFWTGNDGKIYSSWWHAGGNWDNHVFQIPGNYPPPAPGTKITSISREPNHLDIFWIGNDGKIYSSWWHAGGNWDNHVFQVPGNYPQPAPSTNIASVCRESNHLDIFWIGNDGMVYSSWWHVGGTWNEHVFQVPGNYIAPAPGTNISSVSREPNHLDIFWIGNDGKLYSSWWHTGGNWDNHAFQIPGTYEIVVPSVTKNNGGFSVSRNPNHVDIFWIGDDEKIYSSWWNIGNTWDNHIFPIPGNYPPPAPGTTITSCSRNPNHVDIFWTGNDGKIYSSWWHTGTTWDNHVFQIPGNYPPPAPGTNVTSISREPNHVDIFWVGDDGKIYSSWWHADTTWDNHVFLIPGEYPAPEAGTNITSVSREPNHLDIFWIGNDGKIYSSWWHAGTTWDNHVFQIPGEYPPPAPGTNFTSISREPNHVDIFWIGNDGKVYSSWWHAGTTWDNHVFQIPGEYPPPVAETNITCLSREPNHVDIFWIGNDGKVYSSWWHSGDTWNNHVFSIPGSYPPPATGTIITSTSREPNHIDIFWVGSDGKVYSSWWQAGGNWDNHTFQIPGTYMVRP
ncbi:hypothetical protein ACE38W_16400 [Chitinophaga sp. Hz27]|uniref:hypothetical protein n=1 Tax=Chitinophaga sp. Hz27 TaxID=3347169 RepID=UPI0035D8B396